MTRLLLGASFKNVQASWVKDGLKLAQILLEHGANDLGGSLINESISTAAGATFGQRVAPRELRRMIGDAGRHAVERTTLYARCPPREAHPLDAIAVDDTRFGSYHELVKLDTHRYRSTPKR